MWVHGTDTGRRSMVGRGKIFVQSLNRVQEAEKLNVFGEEQTVFNKLKHKSQASCGRQTLSIFLEQHCGGFE